MPKFRSLSNLPTAESCPSGNPVYKYDYELNGELIHEEWQVQKEIESYADGCDVNSLIKRFESTGDSNVLNSRKGFYADVSDMPNDLIDVHNALKAHKAVSKLQKPKAVQNTESAKDVKTEPATDTNKE